MDGDLYDEFGNYIGPELGSDESEGEEEKYGREEEEVRREGERCRTMWVLLLGSEQSECKCARCVPRHSSV